MSPNPLEGPTCSHSFTYARSYFTDEPVIMSLTAYSKAASYAHWAVAVPLIGCVGTGAYYSTF